nr:hypothetical protein [Chromobacterium sp. ASV5]
MAIYQNGSTQCVPSIYGPTSAGTKRLSAVYAQVSGATCRIYEDSNLAVFVNAAYHFISNNEANESLNVRNTLVRNGLGGFSVFDSMTTSGQLLALAGKKYLVIPDLEHGDLLADLGDNALSSLLNFVGRGGHLLLFHTGTCTVRLMENFDMKISSILPSGDFKRTSESLPGLPANLPDSLVFAMNPPSCSSIMALKISDSNRTAYTVLYGNSDNAGVLSFTYGQGRVSYLGWDWCGKSNANWEAVLIGLLQV